jgi:hypothetical protein
MVKVYVTPEHEKHLPWFDNTRLTAIATCPRWGLIRYMENKAMTTGGRAMALEAGSACHEFFAAVRLYQLGFVQGHIGHMLYKGNKLYGEDKFTKMRECIPFEHEYKKGDWSQEALRFCLTALYQSGYYDDPEDRYRTMSNLEAACIGYFDRWNFDSRPIYVRDIDDVKSFVGVEDSFDVVVDFEDGTKVRFTGRIDGVHLNKGEVTPDENKTTSRINEAWSMMFHTAHQVTGYNVAISTMLNLPVMNSRVLGMAIPRPTNGMNCLEFIDLTRNEHDVNDWAVWFRHLVDIYFKYAEDPVTAPRYAHSCSRYFRPCSFISLCASTSPEERRNIMDNEMVTQAWSPLDEA